MDLIFKYTVIRISRLLKSAYRKEKIIRSTGKLAGMVSQDTRITLLFVVVGAILWLISREFIHSELIQWLILIGVGVSIPTVLTERA